MRKEDLIAYVNRDWAGIERSKWRFRAQQARELTPTEKLAIGDALRHHAYSLHPHWPTAEHRAEDLAVHIRVSECLRSVDARKGR